MSDGIGSVLGAGASQYGRIHYSMRLRESRGAQSPSDGPYSDSDYHAFRAVDCNKPSLSNEIALS